MDTERRQEPEGKDDEEKLQQQPGHMGIPLRALVDTYETYILLDAGLPPSTHYQCGVMRVGGAALLEKERLSDLDRIKLTEGCYELAPGAECTLTVSFHRQGSPVRPHGLLRLVTDRGRLERTRVELSGSDDKVRIGYRAPDETIKVSIRAMLEGYRRGKIHLHLEQD